MDRIETPIALIIFNRPDLTQRVFDAIASVRPRQLLVVADGPRFSEEAEKCEQARAIIGQVDWECQVLTNFSVANLGCKFRVSSGLDWVFEQVDEAIILEDDCVPTESFFFFASEMLKHYRNDERIMHIGGSNYQMGQRRTDYSYYFSKYTHVWGWACWRRAWQHYDVAMRTWPKKKNELLSMCESESERQYWLQIMTSVYNGQVDTWDYQWFYACWLRNALAVIPDVNLVSNVGFRVDATHTKAPNLFAEMPTGDLLSIIHPPTVKRDQIADRYTFEHHFGVRHLTMTEFCLLRLKMRLLALRNRVRRNLWSL